MRLLLLGPSIVAAMLQQVARAESVFAQPTPNTAAAQGLEVIGLAIICFSGAVGLGALVAGLCAPLHRRADSRPPRR